MAQYLSDEWFNEMSAAGATATTDAQGSISLREIVNETPFGTVSYVMHIENGVITFTRDSEVADVTFTQNYDTAVALHKTELTIHDAFFAGRIRVSGHLNTLLQNSDALQGITEQFETVRTATTY